MARPVHPEPRFFLQEGSEDRLDEYLSKFFGAKKGVLIRGEKSTSYIESREAARRISRVFPDAIVAFILRDPVYRAISNYWYTVSHHLEDQPIDVLLDESAQSRPYKNVSVSPYAYLNRGRYVDYIDAYADYFSPEQLRILVHEDFVGNLQAVKSFYESIGLPSDFVPPTLDDTINDAPYGLAATPPEIVEFLRSYYLDLNQRLSAKYAVDIGAWGAEESSRSAGGQSTRVTAAG